MSEVFFNGPAGRIEGKLAQSNDSKAPIALVLHPHPQFGGTMNNKVVYNIYKTLFNNGFTVLRMNFRGVGKSMGSYDQGIGEMVDAATAIDWLQIHYPMAKSILVSGFSFGAWIAMQLMMRRPEVNYFIAVAPPVNKYDFSFLSPCPIPGLIVQGDMDSVVSEKAVNDLASRFSKQKNINVTYKVVHGADHFFRDKIELLNEEVDEYVKYILNQDPHADDFLQDGADVKINKKIFLE
jgi:alpha/beta superfamily hydrolase